MALTKVHNRMIDGSVANVVDYGATGDGSTDDTVAIQSALNAGKATVFFPEGTYVISSNLNLPVKICIEGEGYRRTTIKPDTGVRAIFVKDGTVATTTTDHLIKGLSFDDVRIVCYNRVSFLRIEECSFVRVSAGLYAPLSSVDSAPYGGETTVTENVEVNQCRFFNTEYGIDFSQQYLNLRVTNSYFKNIAQRAIYFGSQSSSLTQRNALIENNTIESVGTGATSSYVAGMLCYGDDITVSNNYLYDIKNASYWEVDGIYIKAERCKIEDNTLINAGYRSAIQTKSLDTNGSNKSETIIIQNNQVYFDETGTGTTSGFAGAFASVTGNFYGGINVVNYNATIKGNMVTGAGYGIYAVNSYTPWLYENLTIEGNTINKNRGSFAIFITGAINNLNVNNNVITDFVGGLSGHLSSFNGITIQINPTIYTTDGSIWITSEQQYIDRLMSNVNIAENKIDIVVNSSNPVYGIRLEARDSWSGGAMPTNKGSFENMSVVNNVVNAQNAGAGNGYAYLAQLEPARFVNCWFDSYEIKAKNPAALPSGYGISGYRTYAGSPSGNLTPYWIGDLVLDTSASKWYKSYGSTNTDWAALN